MRMNEIDREDKIAVYLELPLSASKFENGVSTYTIFFYVKLNYLTMDLAIDSKRLELPLDCNSFKKSILASGIYPMFVCTCGLTVCDSIYVNVVINTNLIKWTKFFRLDDFGQPTILISDFSYQFDLDEYLGAISSIETLVKFYSDSLGKENVFFFPGRSVVELD